MRGTCEPVANTACHAFTPAIYPDAAPPNPAQSGAHFHVASSGFQKLLPSAHSSSTVNTESLSSYPG